MKKQETKTKKKSSRKIGRPSKYKQIDLKQVEILAGFGLIDTEIAQVLNISKRTLNYYKKKPAFLHSLKKGKLKADLKVVESLYKRANGYDYEEKHYQQIEVGEGVAVITNKKPDATLIKTITKHVSGDVTACIFWLKNRDPERWRDKTDTELSGDIGLTIKRVITDNRQDINE